MVKYTYDAWSQVLSIDGTGASTIGEYNSLRYRGYYYDSDTGLYYLNSHYYDPVMCRFVNADKYVSTGQGIIGSNMYTYCGYNPINKIDPLGELFFGTTGALPMPYIVEPLPAFPSIPTTPIYWPMPAPFIYGPPDIVFNPDDVTTIPANPSIDLPISQDVSQDVPRRIASRKYYSSRKDAEQAARKAGGKDPIIHAPKGKTPPHFHPNVKQTIKITRNTVTKHDHYFFQKSQYGFGLSYEQYYYIPTIIWCE